MLLGKFQSKQELRKQRLKKVALWTGITLISYELIMALVVRRQQRRDIYNQAVAMANETQKSLVVIGNPDGGMSSVLGRDYGCGEMCIDERGCAKCKTQAVAKLEQVLPTLPSNSAVIFVAGTLEYVKDLPLILGELQRVSGGHLYIARMSPYTLSAFLAPGAQRRILQAPPNASTVVWKPLPWRSAPGPTSFPVSLAGVSRNQFPRFSA